VGAIIAKTNIKKPNFPHLTGKIKPGYQKLSTSHCIYINIKAILMFYYVLGLR